MTRPVIVVVGAGPGVSGSVARTFARDGFDVALLGGHEELLRSCATELTALGSEVNWVRADLRDVPEASDAIADLSRWHDRVDVLHFNPSAFREKDPLELEVDELLEDVAVGVGGLLTAVRSARPWMRAGTRVTVTGSGVADRPWHQAASLGVQKAGVRNLVQSLDARLSADGIRAVSLTVQGAISDTGPFTPDRIAQAIRAASRQDEHSWRSEVVYGA